MKNVRHNTGPHGQGKMRVGAEFWILNSEFLSVDACGGARPDLPAERRALYNVKADPEERTNLIADPKHAAKIAELQALLAKLMSDSGLTPANDRMPLDPGIQQALPDAKIR